MNAIEMKNITMSFGSFKANDNISLSIKKGSVHAIIGENGAGKSTLMSILFGLYKQTKGEILINEVIAKIDSPQSANKLGIGMVHQHFKLVDDFTVLQNIVLNSEDVIGKTFVTYKKAREKVKEIMDEYNFKIDLNKKISNCSVAEQQRTEILKMLYKDSDILIFDEPTAVLSPQEITGFLKAIKNLQKKDKTIIIISHKLDEIKEVANEGTIIRGGKYIGTINPKTKSVSEISEMMVGSKIISKITKSPQTKGDLILDVQKITVNKVGKFGVKGLIDLDLKIHAGEIVAVAGLEGSGQTELINAITGLQKVSKGNIILTHDFAYTEKIKTKSPTPEIEKKQLKNYSFAIKKLKKNIADYKDKRDPKSVELLKKAKQQLKSIKIEKVKTDISKVSIDKKYKLGISHIPEDRHKHGLILNFNLLDNAILRLHNKPPFSKHGIIMSKPKEMFAKSIIQEYDVRGADGSNSIAATLSGGNQQKFIVGREMQSEYNLIIIAQPTRGLDVGAINNIHNHIIKAKKEGKAILLVSYELDEVLKLANTIVVLSGGKKTAELPIDKANKNKIGAFMAGNQEGDK